MADVRRVVERLASVGLEVVQAKSQFRARTGCVFATEERALMADLDTRFVDAWHTQLVPEMEQP